MLTPLQKIAIKRINNDDRFYLTQWWSNKYKLPRNHPLLLELTWEELYLEYVTDCYCSNPDLLKEGEAEVGISEETWKGYTSVDHEKTMQEKLKDMPKVDLSQWQEDIEHGKDEFDDSFQEENK